MRKTEGTALCTNYMSSSPQLYSSDLVQPSCNSLSTRASPTPSENISQNLVVLTANKCWPINFPGMVSPHYSKQIVLLKALE